MRGMGACAPFAAGCGGGETSEPTGTGGPATEGATPSGEEVKERAAAARRFVLPEFQAAIAQLQLLEPPSDEADEWNRFLTAFRAFVSRSNANLATAEKTGDVPFSSTRSRSGRSSSTP
jgi:hypothetical protein